MALLPGQRCDEGTRRMPPYTSPSEGARLTCSASAYSNYMPVDPAHVAKFLRTLFSVVSTSLAANL